MLNLELREDRYFMLGDDIKITVRRARRGDATIGIEAPKGVMILRDSLYEAQNGIEADTKAADIDAAWAERQQQVARG